MDLLTYLAHSWPTLLRLTGEHLALVGSAVGLAILIGVPLGILITRHRWLATPLLALATVVLTLPSIALFGLMIPIFARFGHALGYVPAVTAVFLYSLLPIMRNTYTALANVDPGIQEAGRGIGMTTWQRLRLVDLPLAVPVILGGVRTAVVMNIGVATIAAIIGAGGLGVLILQAISQSNMSKLAVGAVLVSVLAIVADAVPASPAARADAERNPPTMIELDHLTKSFHQKDGTEVRAVDAVSMTVPKGEICVFLGPSGCGKTTTLKMINRLIEPTSGTVRIEGEDTAGIDGVALRRKIGYVIQQIGLFPNMTIEENIMVVPRLLGWDKGRGREARRGADVDGAARPGQDAGPLPARAVAAASSSASA